jgi:hypothetical protein
VKVNNLLLGNGGKGRLGSVRETDFRAIVDHNMSRIERDKDFPFYLSDTIWERNYREEITREEGDLSID